MIASVLNCCDHQANSFVQKFLTTSSLICSIRVYLKSLSVSALTMSNRVESGLSKRARNTILSICSSLAFQLVQKYFLKISINHLARTCLDSLSLISSGLSAKGYFSSRGSNIITSSLRCSGTCISASSIRSQ